MPIKAFIFDMDDVLCTYDVGRRIARLAAVSGRSEAQVQTAIWHGDYFARADRGEWTAEQCLAEFGARLEFPLSRADWVAARRDAMTPIDDMLAFVARIRTHAATALLTNNDRLLAETLDEIFPALRPLFGKHCYVSGELDLAKPDPEIFSHVIGQIGVEPYEALFVDDLDDNVEGAKRAGLHALRFTGFRPFAAALAKFDMPENMRAE